MTGEDVVGKRKPMQERVYLLAPAHRKLVKAPLSEPSVHALRQTAAFVDAFTVRALHAFAPCGDARSIVTAWQVGVGVVFAFGRRCVHLPRAAGCPFGISIAHQPSVSQVPLRPTPVASLTLLQHRAHQAAIGASRLGSHRDNNLTPGDGADLAIISWPKAAIRHLHYAGIRIGRGGARFFLWSFRRPRRFARSAR